MGFCTRGWWWWGTYLKALCSGRGCHYEWLCYTECNRKIQECRQIARGTCDWCRALWRCGESQPLQSAPYQAWALFSLSPLPLEGLCWQAWTLQKHRGLRKVIRARRVLSGPRKYVRLCTAKIDCISFVTGSLSRTIFSLLYYRICFELIWKTVHKTWCCLGWLAVVTHWRRRLPPFQKRWLFPNWDTRGMPPPPHSALVFLKVPLAWSIFFWISGSAVGTALPRWRSSQFWF